MWKFEVERLKKYVLVKHTAIVFVLLYDAFIMHKSLFQFYIYQISPTVATCSFICYAHLSQECKSMYNAQTTGIAAFVLVLWTINNTCQSIHIHTDLRLEVACNHYTYTHTSMNDFLEKSKYSEYGQKRRPIQWHISIWINSLLYIDLTLMHDVRVSSWNMFCRPSPTCLLRDKTNQQF